MRIYGSIGNGGMDEYFLVYESLNSLEIKSSYEIRVGF